MFADMLIFKLSAATFSLEPGKLNHSNKSTMYSSLFANKILQLLFKTKCKLAKLVERQAKPYLHQV